MRFAFIIVTRATNCGALYCDVLFRSQLELLSGAFSRSFVMPANAAGHGSFGNPTGGGRRWVEFRIVLEGAGPFHGEVINAGSNCHRIRFADALCYRHRAASPCVSGHRRRLDTASRLQDP